MSRSARCGALGSLCGIRVRAKTHQQAIDSFVLQATRKIDAVAPDAADSIERDQHPFGVSSGRQIAPPERANGDRRSSWMSLNA